LSADKGPKRPSETVLPTTFTNRIANPFYQPELPNGRFSREFDGGFSASEGNILERIGMVVLAFLANNRCRYPLLIR